MKKKTRILLIVLAIILVLAAAAAVIVLRMNRGSRTPIDNNPEPAVSGNSNVLVAYFSWSGHGRQMANWVAEETGGELFRIVPEVPYGDDFDTVANRAQTELNDSTRQALSAHIDSGNHGEIRYRLSGLSDLVVRSAHAVMVVPGGI